MITLKKHFKKLAVLGVALLGFQSMQAQLSGNYTIDKNNATAGTNFASFADFESALYNNGVSAAVTVQVVAKTGPYSEQVTFRTPISNAPTGKMPVVIYGNGNTITHSSSSSSSMYTVALTGIDYLTLSNLNIEAAGSTYTWGIWFTSSADYNTIDSCNISCPNSTSTTSANSAGVSFSSSNSSPISGGSNGYYNTISNTSITGSKAGGFYYGIAEYQNSYSTTSGNVFKNNKITDFYVYGIYSYYSASNKFIGNKISRPNKTITTTTYGIYTYYSADPEVSENEIYDLFKQNSSYTGTCYAIQTYYNYGSGDITFNKNNIHDNDFAGYFYGIFNYQSQYAKNVLFTNNYIHTNSGYDFQGIYNYYSYNAANVKFENNDIYNKMTNGSYFYGIYNNQCYYAVNVTYSKNKIKSEGGPYVIYGIYSYYDAYYNSSSSTVKIENNDVSYSGSYGYNVYLIYTNNTAYNGAKILINLNKMSINTSYTSGYNYGVYTYYAYYANQIDITNNTFTSNSDLYYFYGAFFTSQCYYATTINLINNSSNTVGDFRYYYGGVRSENCYYAGNLNVYHNTTYHRNRTNYTGTQYWYPLYLYYTYNKMTIKNNVIDVVTTTNSGTFYGLYFGASSTTNQVDDYNLYNIGRGSSMGGYWYYSPYSGQNYTDLSTYQSAGYNKNGFQATPKYLDQPNGKLGLASISLDNRGVSGTSVTTDINGKTRNTTNPDIGAFELDIDLKVTKVSVANSTLCEYKTQAVTVEVKNGSTFPLEDPTLEYRVDAGGKPVAELYKGVILPGATISYTFNTLVEMPGGAHTLYGNVQTRFGEAASFALKGGLAPTGSAFVKGSGFIGTFNSGNPGDPDVVANPDKLIYELKAPTGYTNGKYGTDWAIATLDFVELVSGAGVPSSDTATKAPGAAPGTLTFTPSKAITDKTYKVSYTIYSYTTGCDAPVISREVFVAPRPVVDYNIAPTCGGQKSKFEGASTITSGTYSVMWYFGDGSTSDYVNPEHLYNASGTYQAKLVVTSNRGYKDSVTKTVGVYDNPIANFTYNNTCDMNPATFKATSTSPNAGKIVNVFDFGDGNTATGDNLTHTYNSFGEFPVTLTTTDAVGCVTKVTKNFTHTEKPNASFTVNNGALICSQATSNFTNTSTNVSGVGYEWNFGDGFTSVTSNASHQYATDGQFDVKLIARSEAGCEEVSTKTITVQKGADIKFGYNGNCNGQLVKFSNTTVDPTGTTYTWNFGDGSTSTDRAAVHQYGATGNFDVVVTAVTGAGCVTSSTQSIVVGEKPVAFFSTSKESACTDDNIDINNGSYASSSSLTYAWDLGNGTTSTDAAPSVTYANAGTFVIQLITSAGACTDTATQSIKVTKTPDATFMQTSEGLGLGGIVFNPNEKSGTGTYVWSMGDGTIKKDKTSFTYKYAPTGYFRACLERNDNGCVSISCQDIIINSASVTKATENGLNIYPNPTKGAFTLMPVNGNIGMSTVSVINAVGQTILNVNVDLTSGYNMNLDNVAPGIYTVNVISGNTQYNQKVTIVK